MSDAARFFGLPRLSVAQISKLFGIPVEMILLARRSYKGNIRNEQFIKEWAVYDMRYHEQAGPWADMLQDTK